MSQPDTSDGDRRLGPLFILIVIVEALTLAALYAFGRYFS
jgi:hypothetical protein